MQAGHVYICNLKIMEGLPCRKDYYCCAPMCLLYVNGSKQLVPIAIQLKQEPGDENPIFLPSDNLMDWLVAKIYYQSAHAQVINSLPTNDGIFIMISYNLIRIYRVNIRH